jgi:hypothetical protein
MKEKPAPPLLLLYRIHLHGTRHLPEAETALGISMLLRGRLPGLIYKPSPVDWLNSLSLQLLQLSVSCVCFAKRVDGHFKDSAVQTKDGLSMLAVLLSTEPFLDSMPSVC